MTRLATAADKEALYAIADANLRAAWPDISGLELDRTSFFNQFDDPGTYIGCSDDASAFIIGRVYPARKIVRIVSLQPHTMSGIVARGLIKGAFLWGIGRANLAGWRVGAILKKRSAVEMGARDGMMLLYGSSGAVVYQPTSPVGIALGLGPDEIAAAITAEKLATHYGVSL